MNKELSGKTVLITAAAQGIGRATTELFINEGATVIATDLNVESLAVLESEQCSVHCMDVTDKAAIEALSNQIGIVDVLFNCAGYVHNGTLLECSETEWDFSFELNVKSIYLMLQAFLPMMVKGGGGSIINVASVASSIKGVPNRCVYGSTKAAVIGLTKSIAADYIQKGIRCNVICPGTVESPSLDARLKATGDYAAAKRDFIARQPMGRIGMPAEVAALALYLASDQSAYTTGQTHIIDGGWSI